MPRSDELKKVIALCDYITTAEETDSTWSFDFALFGYALGKLDEYLKEDRYYMFLKSFCDGYSKKPPPLGVANDAAPALVFFGMYEKTKSEEYCGLIKNAFDFLEAQPRIKEIPYRYGSAFRAVNIQTLISDLLVRYLYLKRQNDNDAVSRLIRQSAHYAECLMDKKDKLFYHSYMPDAKLHFPIGRNYSGRDNALALFALSMLADGENYITRGVNELIAVLTSSILKYQNTDGTYGGFLKNKRKSQARGFITDGKGLARETSGGGIIGNVCAADKTANDYDGIRGEKTDCGYIQSGEIAAQSGETDERGQTLYEAANCRGGALNEKTGIDDGILNGAAKARSGARRADERVGTPPDPSIAAYYAACCLKNADAGIIDDGYTDIGRRAFLSGLNSLTNQGGAIYMPDITRKSIVQSIMPGLFTKLNLKTKNNLYGVAGLIFAAIEFDKKEKNKTLSTAKL
jgi:rhamnogalacturonyl hydrolase YesR